MTQSKIESDQPVRSFGTEPAVFIGRHETDRSPQRKQGILTIAALLALRGPIQRVVELPRTRDGVENGCLHGRYIR